MIKFGDINIVGMFFGDIPITSAFKGEDLVYSSKPKYGANDLVLEITTTKPNEVWQPKVRTAINYAKKIDYGDGIVKTGSPSINESHTYKEPGVYTLSMTLGNSFADYGLELDAFYKLSKIIHIPDILSEGLRLYATSHDYSYRIRELDNPKIILASEFQAIIGVSEEMTLGKFNISSDFGYFQFNFGLYGDESGSAKSLFKRIVFKPNFEGNLSHISIKAGTKITELLGNIDYSNYMYPYGPNIEINSEVLKIDNYLITTLKGYKLIGATYGVTEPLKLTYLHIGNLGNKAANNTTYDFSNISKWGDDAFAESVGITGAKQSLIDTINDALDVTGKNITIKFSPETLATLTTDEKQILINKGYKIL